MLILFPIACPGKSVLWANTLSETGSRNSKAMGVVNRVYKIYFLADVFGLALTADAFLVVVFLAAVFLVDVFFFGAAFFLGAFCSKIASACSNVMDSTATSLDNSTFTFPLKYCGAPT